MHFLHSTLDSFLFCLFPVIPNTSLFHKICQGPHAASAQWGYRVPHHVTLQSRMVCFSVRGAILNISGLVGHLGLLHSLLCFFALWPF